MVGWLVDPSSHDDDCFVHYASYLIDLVIQHTNGAPKGGVPSISIHRLLISFISLVVVLFGHIASTEEVPGLGIVTVGFQRSCQVLNSQGLITEGSVLLMVKPA